MLTRATIPQGHNSSCFNLDEKPGGAFSGMVARHVEICPWEAERYRRALWWTLPENTRDEKYDWASMQFEEYPQWAKDALDGEPREDTLPEWKFPHPNGWEVANSPGNPWSNPSSAAANGGRPGAPPLPGQIPGAASQNVPLLGKRPMGLVTDTSDPDSSFPIK